MAEKKDYYAVLGVDKKASKDEIKKAFHKLAHKFHPDKSSGDADKFKELSEAYSILSDDKKRAEYDSYGRTFGGGGAGAGGFGGFQGADFDFSPVSGRIQPGRIFGLRLRRCLRRHIRRREPARVARPRHLDRPPGKL